MPVLFDGEPHVHYGPLYLDSRGEANPLFEEGSPVRRTACVARRQEPDESSAAWYVWLNACRCRDPEAGLGEAAAR